MEDINTSLMSEIHGRLTLIESNLPKRLDAMAVSTISKLPFKVLLYRETLIWRMAELGRSAFQCFEQNKVVSAIVLARAAVETSAALWYLCAKVAASLESNAICDIDDCLMRLVAGIATGAPETEASTPDESWPRPVRVNNFVKQANKDIEGFNHQFGVLCEFAHPNWAGTVLLYAKHDHKNRLTDFGQDIRKQDNAKRIGVCNLSVALAMFETCYNRLGDLVPAFTKLCESLLKEGDESQTEPK